MKLGLKLRKQARKMFPKGFTLIELLVVVLIIGLLAAVAVPQYNKAVQKAKYTRMRVLGDSLAKGAAVAFLRTGVWPRSFDELEVSLPAGLEVVPTQNRGGANASCLYCAKNEEMFCCLVFPRTNYNGGAIDCSFTDKTVAYTRTYATDDEKPTESYQCAQLERKSSFCEHLPNAKKIPGTGVMTPDGWNFTYQWFTFD